VAASGRAGLSRDTHPIESHVFHVRADFVLSRKRVTRVANGAETWNPVPHWPTICVFITTLDLRSPEPGQVEPSNFTSIGAQQKPKCWSPIFGQRVAAVLCAPGFHLICTGRLFGVGFGGWPVAASGPAHVVGKCKNFRAVLVFPE